MPYDTRHPSVNNWFEPLVLNQFSALDQVHRVDKQRAQNRESDSAHFQSPI